MEQIIIISENITIRPNSPLTQQIIKDFDIDLNILKGKIDKDFDGPEELKQQIISIRQQENHRQKLSILNQFRIWQIYLRKTRLVQIKEKKNKHLQQYVQFIYLELKLMIHKYKNKKDKMKKLHKQNCKFNIEQQKIFEKVQLMQQIQEKESKQQQNYDKIKNQEIKKKQDQLQDYEEKLQNINDFKQNKLQEYLDNRQNYQQKIKQQLKLQFLDFRKFKIKNKIKILAMNKEKQKMIISLNQFMKNLKLIKNKWKMIFIVNIQARLTINVNIINQAMITESRSDQKQSNKSFSMNNKNYYSIVIQNEDDFKQNISKQFIQQSDQKKQLLLKIHQNQAFQIQNKKLDKEEKSQRTLEIIEEQNLQKQQKQEQVIQSLKKKEEQKIQHQKQQLANHYINKEKKRLQLLEVQQYKHILDSQQEKNQEDLLEQFIYNKRRIKEIKQNKLSEIQKQRLQNERQQRDLHKKLENNIEKLSQDFSNINKINKEKIKDIKKQQNEFLSQRLLNKKIENAYSNKSNDDINFN